MPAACDQAAERALRRGDRIDVYRLRIEFPREGDRFALVDGCRAVLVCRADNLVLEMALVDRNGEVRRAHG
jgi:hypothetical protein